MTKPSRPTVLAALLLACALAAAGSVFAVTAAFQAPARI